MGDIRIHRCVDAAAIEQIKVLARRRKTAAQIGEILSISERAILKTGRQHRIAILSYKPRPWSAAHDQAILDGVASGRTWAEMAKEMRRTPDATKRRYTMHLNPRSKPKPPPAPPTVQYTYTSITARVCGDPPEGRDYLSRRLRGEV